MRSLRDSVYAMIDLGIVLTIGIVFIGLMIVAYMVWELRDKIAPTTNVTNDITGSTWQSQNGSVLNITAGFDSAINLILIAVTITILAIAISALLMLRGR